MFPHVDSAADPDNPLGQSLISMSSPEAGDRWLAEGPSLAAPASPSFASSGPTFPLPSSPSMFIPATGGAPVMGIPFGRSTGGPALMIPVTGGPPVMGIPF
jgi:hypothetical protein